MAAARRQRFATPTKWPSTLGVAIGASGQDEQAQAQCDEAKAIADRLGATALRVAAENLTVRV